MEELYKKLKKYTLEDALEFENKDRQFIALQKLYNNYCSPLPLGLRERIQDRDSYISEYLSLVICNSIICYQLSGKGEEYWEEFSNHFSDKKIEFGNVIYEVLEFMKCSKNNKRLVEIKIKRLEKLKPLLEEFIGKEKEYYSDMNKFRDILSKTMKQDKNAKTIVFTVKMFGYSARNIFDFEEYPKEINIPVDSRLKNIFEKYKGDYIDINKFYFDLSNKLNIGELHLDGIVWNLYEELL